MRDLFEKIKIPLIIIFVLIVLAVAYNMFFKKPANTGSLNRSAATSGSQSGSARELLTLLNKVNTVKFDSTLFQNENYKSLRNFAQTIVSEPRGKRNPFAYERVGQASSSVESLGFEDELSQESPAASAPRAR